MTVMTNVVLVLKDSEGNIGIVKTLTDKDIIKIADAITDVGQVVDPATHMPIEATTASVGVVQLATAQDIKDGTANKVVDAKELADALAKVEPGGSIEFSAVAGENINTVGTPTVAYNDGTFTFNYLKGEKGDKGDKGDTGSVPADVWRSSGATWNPGANVSLNASANNQEWSFDIKRNGYTGCYWHVWDSSFGTLLKVNADDGSVAIPQNKLYLGSNMIWIG